MAGALADLGAAGPSVTGLQRLRHEAGRHARLLLDEITESIDATHRLFGRPSVISSPIAESAELRRDGARVVWCWETGKYEDAAHVETVAATARKAREAAEARAAAAAALELRKPTMSKRERRKVEAAEADEAERAAAELARSREVAAAEAERLRAAQQADPVWVRAERYRQSLHGAVSKAVGASLGAFAEAAAEIDRD